MSRRREPANPAPQPTPTESRLTPPPLTGGRYVWNEATGQAEPMASLPVQPEAGTEAQPEAPDTSEVTP